MRLIEMALIAGAIALFVVVNAKDGPPRDEWQLSRGGDPGQVHFTIDHRDGLRNHWGSSRDVPWARFTGLAPLALDSGGKLAFRYATDAGTLICQGEARLGRANGTFRFEPSQTFATELAKLGFNGSPSGTELFGALMHGITLDLARFVAQTGLTTSYRELEEMAIHGIDTAYLRDIRAQGYENLRAQDFVKARIHGVDAKYLGQIKQAGYDLPMDRMVELKIHGVSEEYLQGIKTSGLRPEARELIELRNHGVTPEYLKALAESGHKDMPAREVIELRIHGVTPEFVRETRAAGYEFTAREMTELRIHGVDADYLDKLKASGFARLPAQEIVKLKTHGID